MNKINKRISFLVMICIMAVLMSAPVWADTAKVSIDKISYPTITLTGGDGERAVTWWAPKDATEVELFYGKDSLLSDKVTVPAKQSYLAEGSSPSYTGFASYEAIMKKLQNNKQYFYQIKIKTEEGIKTSEIYSFQSGDETKANRAFSFLYMGDAQTSSSTSQYDQWLDLLNAAGQQGQDIAFTMMGGDMVNNGQNAAEWEEYLKRASQVFQNTPAMTIPGNHECNSIDSYKPTMYQNLLAIPQNGPDGFKEEFYSFDYGNCHILAVNSDVFEQLNKNKITDADMKRIEKWMKTDLERAQADFNIVVTHHPAYSVVFDSISNQVLQNWAPIFEQANVDLILCGHQHVYMRTQPMLNGKGNYKSGVVSIMGVSGSKLYAESDVAYADVMHGNVSNYQLISVNEDQLTVTTKDIDGALLDQIAFKSKEPKRKEVAREKAAKELGKQKGIKVTATSYNQIKVSWSINAAAEGYQLYESKGSGAYKKVVTLNSRQKISYLRSKLATGSTYRYKVRAYKKVKGETVLGSFSDVKNAKPSLKKTRIKLKAGKKKATIQWKKISGASGYKIYRSTKKTKSYKLVKSITRGSTAKYTNSRLKKGRRYYYKVRAFRNVNGKRVYGSLSSARSARVK